MSDSEIQELEAPDASVVDGDGKEKGHQEGGDTEHGESLAPPEPQYKGDVTLLEDALDLVARLDRIAVIGAPSVIPNRDMADFLSRKLAKSIAWHPDVRNGAYIQELVDTGFSKRNAQKIVWTARKLSRAIPVDTSVIRAAPAIPEASVTSGVREKAIAVQPAPEKPAHKRGDNLSRNYPEIFAGYERFNHKRKETPENEKGAYFASNPEIIRYGNIWQAVGFQMVPEDLPKILPELQATGLLELYRVDADVIRELEEERKVLLDAGKSLSLVPGLENSDQVPARPTDC